MDEDAAEQSPPAPPRTRPAIRASDDSGSLPPQHAQNRQKSASPRVLNGFLAMSEIAIVSARKARLRQQAESGPDKPRAARLIVPSEQELGDAADGRQQCLEQSALHRTHPSSADRCRGGQPAAQAVPAALE